MVTAEPILDKLGVLVTRPEGQAENICHLLEQVGAKPIPFPVLEIVDLEDNTQLLEIIDNLENYDIAIFISPNAVKKSANLIQTRKSWPKSVKIAAVGKASAKALDTLGLITDIFPSKRFNSEALLEMPEMHQVQGKNIVIFRGEGGRETLAESLKARGATVNYAECYRRRQPKADVSQLLRYWARGDINLIITTSNEGLHNLYDMVGNLGRQWLVKSPLVVLSDRAEQLARQLGFKNQVLIAEQASDEAIIKAIINWRQQRSQ